MLPLNKLIVLLLLLTTGVFKVSAQKLVTPESYLLLLYYNDKQEANYKVTSTNTKIKDGKSVTEGSSFNMSFKITSFTDTSAVMEIKYSNIAVIGEKTIGFDEMAKATEALTIKVSLDYTGAYSGFLNYHECKKTFDKMLTVVKKAGKQDSITLKAWELIEPIFADRATIEYALLEDFFHLMFVYGPELSRKTPIKADVELGNLIGGDPYPAKLVMTAGAYVPNKFIEVISRIDLDKKAGKSIIKESLAQLLGIPEITDMHIQKFNFSDTYTHVLDADNGWAKSVVYKRTVSIDNQKSLKEVKFTQIN